MPIITRATTSYGMPSLAVASSRRYITQAGRPVTGSIWPGSQYSPDGQAAVTGRAARLSAAAAVPARDPPAWLLPSAPAAAATARLASAISPVPTALKRSRSSAAIGPAPSRLIEPNRRGNPPAIFGAGLTSGPAEILTAASLLAMPCLARLTVAQVNSTATMVMTARSETACRVLMVPAVRGGAGPRRYEGWVRAGYFTADAASPAPPFTIMIPPPNVTGSLHIGHALDHTLIDALIRRRRMQGYNALWLPGTDHAGIATQNVVERDLAQDGLSRHDLGREAFVARVWQGKATSGGKIGSPMRP